MASFVVCKAHHSRCLLFWTPKKLSDVPLPLSAKLATACTPLAGAQNLLKQVYRVVVSIEKFSR